MHSSRSHNDNTESVLIGRILALYSNYFLNFLIYLLQRMAIIYKMAGLTLVVVLQEHQTISWAKLDGVASLHTR